MPLQVLVVDDEKEVLGLIRSMIEPLGCEVETLSDSQEAARRLQTKKFDGVLLDVVMPRMDGLELTRQIRRSPVNRETPIVMISGLEDVNTMRLGFSAGATAFLGKPISRERLQTLIKAMRGPMAEKRRFPRLPLRTKVRCRPGPGFDREFVADSSSISEGGISFGPSGGVVEGQELELEFTVPSAITPLSVRGRVVHCELTDRVAIAFVDADSAVREAIRRYIEGTSPV